MRPCQCDRATAGVPFDPANHCHSCWLWLNVPEYRLHHEGSPGGAVQTPARRELPCVRLGDRVNPPPTPLKDWRHCEKLNKPVCSCQECQTCPHFEPDSPDLKDTFDRVVVVNLARRADRWGSIQSLLRQHDWPFRWPVRFEAIDGNRLPMPRGWEYNGGTWGCLQSHRQILERAILDGVDRLLILEDDATVRSTFRQDLDRFIAAIPPDWEGLMFGGQHFATPIKLPGGIVKCINTQRTHAYAVRGRWLRDLYSLWMSKETWGHCDHVMGPPMKEYKIYAPERFLFGQAAGQSDIIAWSNPAKFWDPPLGTETILILDTPREVAEGLREHGVHIGFQRDSQTGIDVGLIEVFDARKALSDWVSELMWEVASMENTLLGVWHPQATVEMFQSVWRGPVRLLKAETLEEATTQLKAFRGALHAV